MFNQNLVSGRGLTFETIFAFLATTICGLLGGWDTQMKTLALFIVLDYGTGFLGACKQHRVDSDVMFWGAVRKGVIFLIIMMVVKLDALLGNSEPIFRSLTMYFYIAREGISIVENLGVLNVPIPAFITKVLTQLQEKGENTNTKKRA